MGTVNYNVLVEKDVDLSTFVNLNVDKDVFSSFSGFGNLAEAEAAADAIPGANGTGGGGIMTQTFLIDDGTDLQTTVAIGATDPMNRGTAPGPAFPPPLFNVAFPDGEDFLGTDIPAEQQRIFDVNILSGEGQATLTSGLADDLSFSNDDGTTSNQFIRYWRDGDNDGDFGDGAEDCFSVCLPGTDLSDPTNALRLFDFDADPGVPPGSTVRVEIVFGDCDGTVSALRAAVTDEFVDENLSLPLGLLTGDIPIGTLPVGLPIPDAGGTPINGLLAVDASIEVGGDGQLDLEQIAYIEIRILDNPNVFVPELGGPTQALLDFEDPGTGGVDISIDQLDIFCQVEVEDGDGSLAETLTTAQATDTFAQAFSSSIAAVDTSIDTFDF